YNLTCNTTEHLLADIERLREFLNIDRWMVFGGSWGCTLGLAYAQQCLDRVTGMILVGIKTTRLSEDHWLYRGVAPMFPEQWARFRDGVPTPERDGDLVSAYHRLLMNPDPAVHTKAASDWCAWEEALLSIEPDAKPAPRRLDPKWQLAFA